MTTQEFKEKYPQYKDLEGDALWNKIEDTLLQEKISKPKRYQLRWLFYRNKENFKLGGNNYTSTTMCNKCNKGISGWLTFLDFGGNSESVSICPHCKKNMKPIPNTNLNHKIWKAYKKSEEVFWKTLDYLHICRNVIGNRYDMFNDEHYLVKHTLYDKNWNHVKTVIKKRRWWEYLIIEKH